MMPHASKRRLQNADIYDKRSNIIIMTMTFKNYCDQTIKPTVFIDISLDRADNSLSGNVIAFAIAGDSQLGWLTLRRHILQLLTLLFREILIPGLDWPHI